MPVYNDPDKPFRRPSLAAHAAGIKVAETLQTLGVEDALDVLAVAAQAEFLKLPEKDRDRSIKRWAAVLHASVMIAPAVLEKMKK